MTKGERESSLPKLIKCKSVIEKGAEREREGKRCTLHAYLLKRATEMKALKG